MPLHHMKMPKTPTTAGVGLADCAGVPVIYSAFTASSTSSAWPFDLHLAPFLSQFAVLVNEEGTPHNAHELPAVERFFLDDVELFAELLVRIRNEIKGKALLFPEFLVRGNAVTRNAKNDRVLAPKFGVQRAEITAFGRAAGRAVFRVEIDDDVLAAQLFELDFLVTGRSRP